MKLLEAEAQACSEETALALSMSHFAWVTNPMECTLNFDALKYWKTYLTTLNTRSDPPYWSIQSDRCGVNIYTMNLLYVAITDYY